MDYDYRNMKDFRAIYKTEQAYHHTATGFRSWFLRDNYESIAKECCTQDTALDLGCGEGCLGQYLDVKWLAGVDYSEDALSLCKKLYPDDYDELHLGDMRSIEKVRFAKPSYDLILCSISLMYLFGDDLEKCLRDVHSLLSSGGCFVFTYPTLGPHRKGSPEAAELPPDELLNKFLKVGFELEKMLPICPLVPKSVVDQSTLKESEEAAYRAYANAKANMSMETSYHFLCKVSKK